MKDKWIWVVIALLVIFAPISIWTEIEYQKSVINSALDEREQKSKKELRILWIDTVSKIVVYDTTIVDVYYKPHKWKIYQSK